MALGRLTLTLVLLTIALAPGALSQETATVSTVTDKAPEQTAPPTTEAELAAAPTTGAPTTLADTTTSGSAASSPAETSTTESYEPTEPEAVTKVLEDTLGESSAAPTTTTTPASSTTREPTTTTLASESTTESDDGVDVTEAPASLPDGLLGKSVSNAHTDGANSVPKEESDEALSDYESAKLEEQPANENGQPGAGSRFPSQLNLTEIDQIYSRGVVDERESADNWNSISKKLKKSITGIIGNVVPFALNMSQEAKIGSNCSGAMLKWVLSMNQLKAWALKMLDASGKPIAGLLEGSMTMFGNYRQCLKVRAPDDDEIEFAGEFREYFRGKYCVIQAKPWLPEKDRFYNLNSKLKTLVNEEENEWYDRTIFEELNEWLLAFNFVNIRYDICVPSACSREDIQKAVNYLLGNLELKARVLRCETDQPNDGHLHLAAQVESGSPEVAEALMAASTLEPGSEISAGLNLEAFSQLRWMLIPALVAAAVVVATIVSFVINDQSDDEKTGKLRHTIRSLSLKRSVSSHLHVDYGQLADDKPLALYGLRFLLVLWVIMVESIVNLKFEYLRELMMLKDLIFWWPAQFIINSTMQYDSFILLTAFTMGYKNCLNDGVNNVKAITRYVLDKYVRLMPSMMVMVAFVVVAPLAYRGPVWNDYVTKQSSVCQNTGWVNVVFLQNYLPYDQICLPQTWLLCVEFQLLLIMAPIVYYLNKSYIANFGVTNKSIMLAGNGMLKRQAFLRSTSRRDDSSRAFYWLWTAPGTILAGCIALGLGSSFYNVYFKELPPSWFYTMADPDSKALYFGEHMTKIWTHIAVFAIGILAGVECRRATRNVYRRGYKKSNIGFMSHANTMSKQRGSQTSSASSLPIILAGNGSNGADLSKLSASDWNNTCISSSSISINIHNNGGGTYDDGTVVSSGSDIGYIHNDEDGKARSFSSTLVDIICFILAITIMSAIIFSTHEWSLNELPRPLVAGIFDAASRFLWSIAMIWILYKISVPNSDRSFSCIARALGHPVMVFLGKLSFLIYIIHPFVHTLVLAIQEQPIYSSWLMLFHILLGNITLTVILASLVSIFVEMPCRNLFRRCGTSLLLTQPMPAGRGGSATPTETV